MSTEAALAELSEHAGAQFDPRIVLALTEVVERFELLGADSTAADDVRAVLAENAILRHGGVGAAA
jgi:HD-GYP domain-containing protein (c-di-GMP phosphodiesterase class II)